jgi:hypothetical protein
MPTASNMTNSQTSPATKLSQIFEQAYKLPVNVTTAEVWKQVLRFNVDRDRTIENKYLTMLQLFQYVKGDLAELYIAGVNTEKFSNAVDTILSNLFSIPLSHPWQSVVSTIEVKDLQLIESCGDVIIAKGNGLKDISESEVEQLLLSVTSLISEINDLDIDTKTKQDLIKKLDKIAKALEDYQVFGATIFQKIADESFIETVIINQTTDKSKWSNDGISKFKDIVDFLFKLTTICSSLEKTYPHIQPLAEQIVRLLPPGN